MKITLSRGVLLIQFLLSLIVAVGQARKALVIGISDYPKYTTNPIKFAHVDAIEFKKFLEGGSAGRVDVKELLNDEATRDAIWDAVDSLQHEQPIPDTLFVFFSGHAELDSDTGDLYLMPSGGDPNRLSATGVPASEFIKRLKAIGTSNLLIFLDACHAGAAILAKGRPGTAVSVSGSLDPLIETLNKGSNGGTMLFVSAAKGELSWEDDEFGEGLFTRFLIKGLEGAASGPDDGRDGRVTAGDLQTYLTREVPIRARALGMPAQNPFVSPDFRSDYVIAVAPRSPQPRAPSIKAAISVPDIERLQKANPELALMVRTGIQQSASENWGADNTNIIQSFEAARLLTVGKLSTSTTASLISPIISEDGSVLVACAEPYSLVSIPLKGDVSPTRVTLERADSPTPRRTILDSCDISVALDHRFAIARLRTIDGKSRLWLVNLQGGASPISVSDYETGAFLTNVLLLGKGSTLTVFATDNWGTLTVQDLGKPITDIVADPKSGYFAVLRDIGGEIYQWDSGRSMLIRGSDLSGMNVSGGCTLTGMHLYCINGSNFWYRGFSYQDGGSGGYGCDSGSPRPFPSSGSVFPLAWELLYECATDPETLHLLSGVVQQSSVQVTEPVLAARLVADGKVVVVGQRGGIYTFDSIKYGDCCTLENVWPDSHPKIAAGNSGVTAIFHSGHEGNQVAIYHAHNLVFRSILSDTNWVKEIALSESNRTLMLVGDSRIRLIELTNEYKKLREEDVDCGAPTALARSDQTFVCLVPGTQKVQLRSVASGKVEREFEQHVGPVQHLYADATTVIAAGAFRGRSQTRVTIWNPSNGRVISQRSCPVGSAQADKPFSFLRRGDYYAQLDTPTQLVARESLTCEPSQTLPVPVSTTVRATSAAAGVAVWAERSTWVRVLDPWREGGFFPLWNFDLDVSEVALSPDGTDAVISVGGRVLRIPITLLGFLELVKQRLPREFSAQECAEFFGEGTCPLLKR